MTILKVHPLPNSRYTDGFDPHRGYVPGVGDLGPHRGLDMAAPAGAPIKAAHDGVVRRKYEDTAGGNLIYLTGNHDGETFETSYQHMIQPSPLREGQRIRAGQIVGYVGKTGYANGNHLHFELWRHGVAWGGGTATDPLPHLNAIGTTHTPDLETEEQLMSKNIGHYVGGSRNTPAEKRMCVIYNPVSGFYTTWSGTSQAYINDMARAYNTGSFNLVTKKHWDQTIKPILDEIRRK